MRKNIITLLLLTLFAGASLQTNAQAPYKHGIGAVLGTSQAVSYKVFPTNHFAIQLDLGAKYNYNFIAGYGASCWSMELAPSFVYEGHFVKGLYGFIGGGVSLGFSFYPAISYYVPRTPVMQVREIMGKFGAHSIAGLEYKFNFPLTLQVDVRPGYRFLFNNEVNLDHTFDWGMVNFGARYTF